MHGRYQEVALCSETRLLGMPEAARAALRDIRGNAGHDGKLNYPVCGVVNRTNWFAICAASVMSVPPWPSAAVTKLVAM